MKKILFLAAVFVTGAATAGIAQLSSEKTNVVADQNIEANYQDTTKPKKDTVPPKKDSSDFKSRY